MLLSPSPDARTAASVLAVDNALAWYIDEVPRAQSPPLDQPTAQALRAALKGAQRWSRRSSRPW